MKFKVYSSSSSYELPEVEISYELPEVEINTLEEFLQWVAEKSPPGIEGVIIIPERIGNGPLTGNYTLEIYDHYQE